ncbi:MAG: hypothetical protein RL536_45, partial [Candidatus Parcubacteria bacterium]
GDDATTGLHKQSLQGSSRSGTIFLSGYRTCGTNCVANTWTQVWGGNDSSVGDLGTAVALDTSGNLALTGQLYSLADLGGGLVVGNGYFIAKFNVSGNNPPLYKWAQSAGNSTGLSVSFDTQNHLIAGGTYKYTVDFGGNSSTAPVGTTGGFTVEYLK